jgi:RNA polymerase sigma factor (sigma-70 family)
MSESALLRTYREYEWELLRFLARRLGSPTTAADIAHDLYLKLLSATDHPLVHDHRAYVFTMAANLAADHLRVEKRRAEILEEVDGLVWRRTDELTPERHALARAELDYLTARIAELPQRCQQVFYLSRFEGKSQTEIAKILGVGVTTVYKDLTMTVDWLVSARRRFRGLAADEDEHGKG